MGNTPRIFISHAWEADTKLWVQEFATKLRRDGIDARIDRWELALGDPVTEYMESSIRENDFVLIICTPLYKLKADSRKGGVGYEGHIITGEIYAKENHRKFIPVLWKGEWANASPSFLLSKLYCDLRQSRFDDDSYRILLNTLKGTTSGYPPIGISQRKPVCVGHTTTQAISVRATAWMKSHPGSKRAFFIVLSALLVALFISSVDWYRLPPSNTSNQRPPSATPTTRSDAGPSASPTPLTSGDKRNTQVITSNQTVKSNQGMTASSTPVVFVISSRVFDGETPIKGARISIVSSPELGTLFTDKNGAFKFEGVHKALNDRIEIRVEYNGSVEKFPLTIGQPQRSLLWGRTK